MKETSIGFKPSEIVSAYHSADYNAIFRYVSSAADELTSNYRTKNYIALQANLKYLKNAFLFLRKEEEANESIGYLVGYLSGVLNAIEEFTFSEEFKFDRLMKERKDPAIDDIPHISEILRILSKTSEMRHGVLADRVEIDKSTLTPIMERLCKLGLTSFSRIGNRKYYYLTALGKEYLIRKKPKSEGKDDGKLTSVQARIYVQQLLEHIMENNKSNNLKKRFTKLENILIRENVYLNVPDSKYLIPAESAEFEKMSYRFHSGYQLKINPKVNMR